LFKLITKFYLCSCLLTYIYCSNSFLWDPCCSRWQSYSYTDVC